MQQVAATDVNGKKGLLHSSDRIYVTQAGILRGYITMASLLTNKPETPVKDIVNEPEEVSVLAMLLCIIHYITLQIYTIRYTIA
jgi:Mg/Co/Ni transporter MgtE